MTNPLLLISIDQLNANDFDTIQDFPVFKDFIENGSYVRSVDSVYPSLTYCCHTSIATGTYPDKHGIYHNEKYNPDVYEDQDWFWYSEAIKLPTIFDLVAADKRKVATLLWPVTGKSKSIHYNVPEIWSNTGESSFSLFLKSGSLKLLPYVGKHQHLLDGKKQPNVDNFTEALAKDLLRKKKLDLTAIHFTELDDARHKYGVQSEQAEKALIKSEERVAALLEILEKKDCLNTTNVILFGDHGGNDFDQAILMNRYFADHKLLTLTSDNQISDYICYANGAGGSCQIHLKEPENSDHYHKVSDLLNHLSMMPGTPIKEFIGRKTAHKKHKLFGDFSFILEAKDGYVFKNKIRDQWIIPADQLDKLYVSDHGYMPSHPNMKTMLFAKGPDIKPGVRLETCSLVDLGATFAHLLKVKLKNPDGTTLTDLLK